VLAVNPPLSLSVSFWTILAIITSPATTPVGLLIVRDLGEPDKAAEFVVAVPLCAICPHELLELSRKISKNTAEKHDRCRRDRFRKI
jgi:hypothetical protein